MTRAWLVWDSKHQRFHYEHPSWRVRTVAQLMYAVRSFRFRLRRYRRWP